MKGYTVYFRAGIAAALVAASLVAACLVAVVLSTPAAAEPQRLSVFLPPENAKLYQADPASLSEAEKWRVRMFGLRLVALDPSVWAVRRSEKTENRRLVALKPYYLRISEEPGFVIESIDVSFKFRKVTPRAEKTQAHSSDSVLDIGFGGEYQAGGPLQQPLKDTSWILRVSAFSPMESGFFFRSGSQQILLKETARPLLETAVDYRLGLRFGENGVSVSLNDEPFGDFEKKGVNRGLVYLMTGWNPIKAERLEVKGRNEKTGEALTFSGMVRGIN